MSLRRHAHRHLAAALLLAAGGTTVSATPASPAATAAADARTDIRTDAGTVRGTVEGDVIAWRGIPYAAAPTGALRWRAPQPATPWQGIRPAATMAPNCIQGTIPGTPAGAQSEDCLFLNIWRPTARATGRQPVLVWIHGGAFVNGGSTSPETMGDALARRGLVVVTFNYRLGRLGFFGHPALTAENPGEPKGNYGLMDQIAALRWVQRNIAAFGGDPANVTVMGESAGGIAINLLLGSPMADGLFRRAIIQSGAGRDFLGGSRRLSQDAPGEPSAETIGGAFARRLGVEGQGAEALAALRAIPAERISGDLSMATLVIAGDNALHSGPMIDGRVVTMSPETMLQSRRQRAMPLMVGATSADLSLDRAADKDRAFAAFGPQAAAARAAFDPDGTASIATLNRAIGGVRNMVEPARFEARAMVARGQPVYLYRFGYVAQQQRQQSPFGADHASDVAYAFDRLDGRYPAASLTAADQTVAARWADYVANFARSGNPNGPGIPRWARYGVATDRLMNVTLDGAFDDTADPWRARLDAVQAMAERR
jgi:para-nitrobenzyl esterase